MILASTTAMTMTSIMPNACFIRKCFYGFVSYIVNSLSTQKYKGLARIEKVPYIAV